MSYFYKIVVTTLLLLSHASAYAAMPDFDFDDGLLYEDMKLEILQLGLCFTPTRSVSPDLRRFRLDDNACLKAFQKLAMASGRPTKTAGYLMLKYSEGHQAKLSAVSSGVWAGKLSIGGKLHDRILVLAEDSVSILTPKGAALKPIWYAAGKGIEFTLNPADVVFTCTLQGSYPDGLLKITMHEIDKPDNYEQSSEVLIWHPIAFSHIDSYLGLLSGKKLTAISHAKLFESKNFGGAVSAVKIESQYQGNAGRLSIPVRVATGKSSVQQYGSEKTIRVGQKAEIPGPLVPLWTSVPWELYVGRAKVLDIPRKINTACSKPDFLDFINTFAELSAEDQATCIGAPLINTHTKTRIDYINQYIMAFRGNKIVRSPHDIRSIKNVKASSRFFDISNDPDAEAGVYGYFIEHFSPTRKAATFTEGGTYEYDTVTFEWDGINWMITQYGDDNEDYQRQ